MNREKKKEKNQKQEEEFKKGSYVWKDGSKYDGEYKETDGVIYRHGNGTYYCAKTQMVYTGQWEMDKMSGKGKLEYSNGASFNGYWKDNNYSGQGSFQWPDTSTLSGNWVDYCVSGPGLYEDEKSQKWSGDFQKGCPTIMAPLLE